MAFKPAVCIALALALSACAGADQTELFEQPVTESGTTLPPTDKGTTPPKPGTDPGTTPAPPKKEEPPTPACATEVEPNNNRQNPTTFTSCVSGKLTANDVDNLTIKSPANAKVMVVKSSGTGGRIQFSLTGGGFFGVNENWTEDEQAPEVPVAPNDTFTFQVRPSGTSGGEKSWKVEVTFE